MKKDHPSPPLEMPEKKARRPRKSTVAKVAIFTRRGSRFYQASVRMPDGSLKRLSTRTTLRPAAAEFAELLYKQISREMKNTNTPPRIVQPDLFASLTNPETNNQPNQGPNGPLNPKTQTHEQ